MKKLSIIALLLVSISVSSTVIYKKTNPDGTVSYSDEPSEGAVLIDQSSGNSAVMPSLLPRETNFNDVTDPKRSPPAEVNYSLTILSPSAEQTVRSNVGEVDVVASISPKASGMFQLILNGELQLTQPSPVFHLQDLQRGEYSLQIRFVGNSGKILALTDTQSFYLHKASALINANK